MKKLFGIPIQSALHWRAKDLSILIYNVERKRYPKLTDQAYEQMLAKRIRQKYVQAKGTKTLIDILKEDYEEVKKKEDK